MIVKCEKCGDEVDSFVTLKPPWFKPWAGKKTICRKCDYNESQGSNLDKAQWEAWENRMSSEHQLSSNQIYPYIEFKNDLLSDLWDLFETSPYTLTDGNGNFVSTHPLTKDLTGEILCIRSPVNLLILVCGKNQIHFDVLDFIKNPILYSIPHEFSIQCIDKDGKELSPENEIYFYRVTDAGKRTKICQELYRDLSLKENGSIKPKSKMYYFNQSIMLNPADTLSIMADRPDIDISSTKLFMKCDIFVKKEAGGK